MRQWLWFLLIGTALTLAYFGAMSLWVGSYWRCDKPGWNFNPLAPPSDNRC